LTSRSGALHSIPVLYSLAEPKRPGRSSEGSTLAGDLDAPRQKKLILIVEDDFVLRTAVAELLTSDGHDVECAADGLEALIRLDSSTRKPAVILLDITMPRMDGVRFRDLQKSLPGIASIPVIAVTGAAKAQRSGFDHRDFHDTFFKPLDVAEPSSSHSDPDQLAIVPASGTSSKWRVFGPRATPGRRSACTRSSRSERVAAEFGSAAFY
jgi:CheY-like chemotaxis protein